MHISRSTKVGMTLRAMAVTHTARARDRSEETPLLRDEDGRSEETLAERGDGEEEEELDADRANQVSDCIPESRIIGSEDLS